jgi:DNA-binding transcriptional ArsR family regulator
VSGATACASWARDPSAADPSRGPVPLGAEQRGRQATPPPRTQASASTFCPLYSAPFGALYANLDRTFFALSDPTRRTILELVAAHSATIGELAQPFGLTLNGVKKHVRVLEDADLVITEKVGRARECRLGPAQLQDAARWIEEYRHACQARLDRFGAYVEQTNAQRR